MLRGFPSLSSFDLSSLLSRLCLAQHNFRVYLFLRWKKVEDAIVFTKQNVLSVLKQCNDQIYSDKVEIVPLSDVIKTHGVRRPLPKDADARKKLLIHSGFLKEKGVPFYLSTRKKGTLDPTFDASSLR